MDSRRSAAFRDRKENWKVFWQKKSLEKIEQEIAETVIALLAKENYIHLSIESCIRLVIPHVKDFIYKYIWDSTNLIRFPKRSPLNSSCLLCKSVWFIKPLSFLIMSTTTISFSSTPKHFNNHQNPKWFKGLDSH